MDKDDVLNLVKEPFGRTILKQLAAAYKTRCTVSIGDNAMTFGMGVRFTAEKFIEDAQCTFLGIIINRPAGSFQVSYRDHMFHFYKFGMSNGDSVDELSFDGKDKPGVR